MAGRIRSIKPEILDDEVVAHLSHLAFRLFVGTWLIADDYGNLRADPDYLRGQIVWGAPDTSREHVVAALEEVVEAELLIAYTVRGQRYLHIRGWSKHQRVDKPGKPRMPGPSEADSPAPRGVSRDSRETPATDLRPPTSDPEVDEDLPELSPARDPSAPVSVQGAAPVLPLPRTKLMHGWWEHARQQHAVLRAELDPDAVPWPPLPSGQGATELVARVRELAPDGADVAAAAEVLHRVVDVAIAEARRDDVRSLKWFTPSRMLERKRFYMAAELSPQQAGLPRNRAGPRSATTQRGPTEHADAVLSELERRQQLRGGT